MTGGYPNRVRPNRMGEAGAADPGGYFGLSVAAAVAPTITTTVPNSLGSAPAGVGPPIGTQHRARHRERPHAVGAHVAEGRGSSRPGQALALRLLLPVRPRIRPDDAAPGCTPCAARTMDYAMFEATVVVGYRTRAHAVCAITTDSVERIPHIKNTRLARCCNPYVFSLASCTAVIR
jgi:hypothetical protein